MLFLAIEDLRRAARRHLGAGVRCFLRLCGPAGPLLYRVALLLINFRG
ncbi:MAG: hypothetical protein FAZ92_03613 [Accumulibacter sp.]|nr:MAG: hypothetical protein FAZ92_03613 [Accumulibacter sp.]